MSLCTPSRPVTAAPPDPSPGPGDTGPDRDGSAGRAPRAELPALTGLRIVAALWVVGFHFHFTALPGVATVSGLLGPLVTQGALGVDLFFVLSGFVIAWTYLDQLGPRLRLREAGGFVWARAARMWPAYAVVLHLFGVWLVARAVFGSGERIAYQAVQPELGAGAWLEQVLGVQLWTEPFLDGASWVGPTWSISAEWLAYLLFPLLAPVFFRLRRSPFAVPALGSLLCLAPVAAAFVVVGSPYYPYSWLVRVLGGFSAGVLAMLAVRRLRDRGADTARLRAAASAASTVLVVALPCGLLAGAAAGGGLHGLVVLLFPVLVGALALADRGSAHRLLSHRIVVHGGCVSYALYLVHIPMFEVLWYLVDLGALPRSGTAVHLVALTVFLGTLPVAHLLFTLIERPARRWLRALPGRPAAAPSRPAARAEGAVREPVDTRAARRDPETSVFPAVVAEPVTEALAVVPRAGRAPALPVPRPTATADGRTRDGRAEDAPAPVGSARWVLERLAAARAAGAAPAAGVPAEPAAAARARSGGPGTGADLFAPLVDGPGAPTGADRVERLRALRRAARAVEDASGVDRGGIVPAPRALGPAPAGTGHSRSGAELCGRSGRRRDDAHGSAATPIVAASGAAAPRRRRRSHGI